METIVLTLIWGFGIFISLCLFASIKPHRPLTEYELYGEGGSDECEREQLRMTKEEYEKYKKQS